MSNSVEDRIIKLPKDVKMEDYNFMTKVSKDNKIEHLGMDYNSMIKVLREFNKIYDKTNDVDMIDKCFESLFKPIYCIENYSDKCNINTKLIKDE